jgi:hypothetical protein
MPDFEPTIPGPPAFRVEAVIVRSGQEPIVVNLDIPSPEDETGALGSDPFHSGAL